MKKKILIGCLISIFLLLTCPSISAIEFNTSVEVNRSQILEQIRTMSIIELRQRIQKLDLDELKEKLIPTGCPATTMVAILSLAIICLMLVEASLFSSTPRLLGILIILDLLLLNFGLQVIIWIFDIPTD